MSGQSAERDARQFDPEPEDAWAGAAEVDDAPANAVPTPAQLLRRMADATTDERLAWAERAIVNSEKAQACFLQNHRARIAYLEQQVADLIEQRNEALARLSARTREKWTAEESARSTTASVPGFRPEAVWCVGCLTWIPLVNDPDETPERHRTRCLGASPIPPG